MRTARRRAGHPSGPLTVVLRRRAGSALLAALVALLVLGTLGACSDDEASGPCEQPEHQRAQLPASHVRPGQPEPSYLSDPPTSGPHAPITSVPPVFAEPVPKPTQVGILERGMVLVQYRPAEPGVGGDRDHPTGQVKELLAFGCRQVRPVVASAWLYLLRCAAVDTGALRDFIDTRTSEAPGGH